MKSPKTVTIAYSALIAALYAAATYASAAAGLAYGPVQFRVSEALTILPVFTPAAIPGLMIGCVAANIRSPYGVVDIICGTLATVLAAFATRALRNARFKNVPWLAPLPPVVFNALIVGAEITILAPGKAGITAFAVNAAWVGLGEFVMCYALGLPLYAALERTKLFSKI